MGSSEAQKKKGRSRPAKNKANESPCGTDVVASTLAESVEDSGPVGDTTAVEPVSVAQEDASSPGAGWEAFIDEERLGDDDRRQMLKIRRKLREVDKIEARIQSGEHVEANQHVKVASRPQLMEQLADYVAPEFRRHFLPEVDDDDAGFIEVTAGVAQGKLRSEAMRLVEAVEYTPCAEPADLASTEAQSQPAAPSKRQKPKKGKKKDGKGDDDAQGWEVVGQPKKKTLTEEERVERACAQQHREAQKVKSTGSVEYERTLASLKTFRLVDDETTSVIEGLINQVVIDAENGLLKKKSVDLTPMRNKYFFGFAYTYGAQREHPGAHGTEAVWDPAETEPIPTWIQDLLIKPLEQRGVVPRGWVNAATINDYAPGGCIVSHIDPPHLFDRPIIGVNFFSDCNLVFGTTFSFPKEAMQNISCSTPLYVHPCQTGFATVLKGYSANDITHAIRPCDLPSRRASIILRRVLPTAPVLLKGICIPLKDLERSRSGGDKQLK